MHFVRRVNIIEVIDKNRFLGKTNFENIINGINFLGIQYNIQIKRNQILQLLCHLGLLCKSRHIDSRVKLMTSAKWVNITFFNFMPKPLGFWTNSIINKLQIIKYWKNNINIIMIFYLYSRNPLLRPLRLFRNHANFQNFEVSIA